jgi:hypothetical protein
MLSFSTLRDIAKRQGQIAERKKHEFPLFLIKTFCRFVSCAMRYALCSVAR